jgi:hypothetical protein
MMAEADRTGVPPPPPAVSAGVVDMKGEVKEQRELFGSPCLWEIKLILAPRESMLPSYVRDIILPLQTSEILEPLQSFVPIFGDGVSVGMPILGIIQQVGNAFRWNDTY